jgi:SAM-dependent methyltransferase
MRRLRFKNEFDAAVNLWTSFGYFLDPAEDLRVLKGVAKALKPGGKFLIDVINADWVKRNKMTKHWERLEDGSIRLEEIELQNGRDFSQINNWTVIRRGHPPASAAFFLRLYNYERMARLMRRAGLIPLKAWGGLDGHPLDKDASHLVVLARKAGF